MGTPASPSMPHDSGYGRHVDLYPSDNPHDKLHVPVQDHLGATAIGGFVRDQVRQEQGRN
ncbi:MAG: hypothetical protein ACJ71Z_13225 [Aeromicrobium sp.]